MAAMDTNQGPAKVFLWTVPRSLSTAFLKCMTYVPDTVAWHEPYHQIAKYSHQVSDAFISKRYQDMVEQNGGADALAKIDRGYDYSDKDFTWVTQQLEDNYPGKKLVFVKEFGASIERNQLHDKIPKGFRHTFLIRSPRKTLVSMTKAMIRRKMSGSAPSLEKSESFDQICFQQQLNELWKFVKAEGLEPHPIIIDADDLLDNPKEIIEAYCNEVGIPFTEDLLSWEAGDDCMTKLWMVSKQTLLTYHKMEVHDGTFASTGFKKPAADTTLEQVFGVIPPVVWEALKGIFDKAVIMEKVQGIIDRELPYYEEMYAERLTINKK